MKKIIFLMMILPLMAICDTIPNKLDVSFVAPKTTLLTTKSAEPTEIVPVEPVFENNAYQIGSAGELKWFEQKTNNGGLNKNAVLTADIDYGGNYWVPIAAGDGGKKYTGTFDGQGYTISNLVLNTEWLYNKYIDEGMKAADARKMIQNSGFIGTIVNPGIVKNLTLDNVTVYSNVNGGLGSSNYSQQIKQPISVGAIVGWICGDNGGGTVDNITVSGNLEAEGIGVALGGIAGNAGGGKILNSTSMVTIKSLTDTSEVYIGGITGYTKNSPVFRNDSWLGEIIVNAGHGSSGGVTGYVYTGTLTVDNVTYNEEGVENAIGKSCDNCVVSGDLDYGIYKIYTVNGKKVCELDGVYKQAVKDGVFTTNNTVDSLVFNRTFVPGKSSTIALPFTISTSNIVGAEFYTLQDVVKNDTGYQVNLVQVNTLTANIPYIVIANQPTITIKKGTYKLTQSSPGVSKSKDNNWELQSIYKYTTGLDRGNRRVFTYGFVARDTTLDGKQWHAGQFVKMGPKAYVYPFRVVLEYVGETALSKSALNKSISEIPETLDVVIIKDTVTFNRMGKRLPDEMLHMTPVLINDRPIYYKYYNDIEINHNDRHYNLKGEVR